MQSPLGIPHRHVPVRDFVNQPMPFVAVRDLGQDAHHLFHCSIQEFQGESCCSGFVLVELLVIPSLEQVEDFPDTRRQLLAWDAVPYDIPRDASSAVDTILDVDERIPKKLRPRAHPRPPKKCVCAPGARRAPEATENLAFCGLAWPG